MKRCGNWRTAFSVFAEDLLLPLVTELDSTGRGDALAAIGELRERLAAAARLVSDEKARAAVDADRFSREIDGLRIAVTNVFLGPVTAPRVRDAGHVIDWSGLDMQRWMPLIQLITTSTAEITRLSIWLQQVLTDSQWKLIQPLFAQAPLLEERRGGGAQAGMRTECTDATTAA